MIAVLLAMLLVTWASPSEAWSGRYRSIQRNHYVTGHRNYRLQGYHLNYVRHRYYHYGYNCRPQHYRYGHYSQFGLHLSPNRSSIHIRFGFWCCPVGEDNACSRFFCNWEIRYSPLRLWVLRELCGVSTPLFYAPGWPAESAYLNPHSALREWVTKYSSRPDKVGYKHSCYNFWLFESRNC